MRTLFPTPLLAVTLLALARCSADSASSRAAAAPPADEHYGVGARPTAVAVVDLNRDRILDIAVANAGDGTISILLGDAKRFREAVSYPAGQEPSHLVAGDLDRDGDADLVIANHETSRFTVMRNDGAGRFPAAATRSLATGARPHIHSVSVADVDGDGWLDVGVESADTGEVLVRRGGREGFLAEMAVPVGTMPYFRLGAADVTGDGTADILVPGHGDGTVRIISRNGSALAAARAFTTQAKPWAVTPGQMNRDRKLDLVVLESDAVSVWLRGSEAFAATASARVDVPGATGLAVGRLDGDEVDDVVIAPWDGDELAIVASQRPAIRRVLACPRPIGLAVADFDDDGLGDIVAACATEDRIVVLRSPLR